MKYRTRHHSAVKTDSYVFQQLLPYIGNKRKLLPLIGRAIELTGAKPETSSFVDLFSGSGVVSRYAKHLGFRVIANDWEPYAECLSRCFIETNIAPRISKWSYSEAIDRLNSLAPSEGWITQHLCPADENAIDHERDRMFFMRKNGMRIDAIRSEIQKMGDDLRLNSLEIACLIAPLLYQTCYASNTSGVFKGFHRGWGGQTGTALYRIAGDLELKPAIFIDNRRDNQVFRADATSVAGSLELRANDITYIDPPYNQHPYGSNYHVLNTVTLWDSPPLSRTITGHGDKSAIRTDWRTERRSAYNSRQIAADEYRSLIGSISSRWILTSYSTDGNIDLRALLDANVARGATEVVFQGYKRYRVSSTRPSEKPVNLEFVLVSDTRANRRKSADELFDEIMSAERRVLSSHPETNEGRLQVSLF